MIFKTYFLFFGLIAHKVISYEYNCRKDYSQQCAEGWIKIMNKDECVSPISYTGPCNRFLQIEHNSKKKKILEEECNIKWPCLNECIVDYKKICPMDWINEEGNKCRPLSTYTGTCLSSYDFTKMTNEQKEIWSNKCESKWPCMQSCNRDYTRTCPQNWVKDNNGLCTAPKDYRGPCLAKASLFSLDKSMKIAYEDLCKVQFPCIKQCSLDMNAVCPKKWIVQTNVSKNSVECIPPFNYKGSCDQNTNFSDLNLEQIEQISTNCNVEWPCDNESSNEINYNAICPEDWTQFEKYCVAPQNYNGPCMKKKILESFSKQAKIEYSEECKVQWPLYINSKEINKSTGLRKGRSRQGAVEPTSGNIISNSFNKLIA